MTCARCELIEGVVTDSIASKSIRRQTIDAALAAGNGRPLLNELYRQLDRLLDAQPAVDAGPVVPQAEHERQLEKLNRTIVGLNAEVALLRKKGRK